MPEDVPGFYELSGDSLGPYGDMDSCFTCRFWWKEFADRRETSDEVFSVCRRYPPVRMRPCPTTPTLAESVDPLEFQQPNTCARDWCGEFEPVPSPATPDKPQEQQYPRLDSLPFYRRARKALEHLVPEKTGVAWEYCTIDLLSAFSFDDLREHSGCGLTTIEEIRKHCHAYGVVLRGDAPPLPDEQRQFRWLGRALPSSLLNRLEKYFLAAGKSGPPITCSINELLAVPSEILSPPGQSGQWMAKRFEQWKGRYRQNPLTIAEQS